jgi:hypothetical protein
MPALDESAGRRVGSGILRGMRQHTFRSAVALAALALFAVSAAAQTQTQPPTPAPTQSPAPNPRFASWKLKPETPPPAGNLSSNIMTYEPWNGTGMKVTIQTTNAAGTPGTPWGYNTMLDGKDMPLTGQAGRDAASVTVINDKINLIIYKKEGKVVQLLLNVLSADNNTLNISYHSTNAAGETRTTYATYERIIK